MHLFTLAGATIVALCGIEGAARLGRAAQRDIERVDAYITLLRYIRMQIDCFARPISEILTRCEGELLTSCGVPEGERVSDILTLFSFCEVSDKEARGIISDFCADFGRNYLGEQLKRCDFSIGVLEERRAALMEELPKKKKLSATLCVSAALAIIILLI